MDDFSGKITLKWMMTGGTPIYGNPHIFIVSGVYKAICNWGGTTLVPPSHHPLNIFGFSMKQTIQLLGYPNDRPQGSC